jgi:co-chaperonin GroES (HSP10)
MKATRNLLIVEIEKQYEDTLQYGSLKLHIDAGFNPTFNLRTFGTVIALPEGKIAEEGSDNEIDPIVQVGDKVYFHYLAVDDNRHLISSTKEKQIRRVFYHWIFAIVRDGEVIPCSGWVLGLPYIDGKGEEITMETESGTQTVKVEYSDAGVITKVNMEKSIQKVVVDKVSEYIGQESNLKKGDICFSKHKNMLNFENEIEGVKYYCFKEDDVDAVLGNVECSKCKNNCPCKK